MNDNEVMKSGRMNERMNDRKIMERGWKMNEWLNELTIYGYYEWQELCVPCRMNEWIGEWINYIWILWMTGTMCTVQD